jgi:hypothetical protein
MSLGKRSFDRLQKLLSQQERTGIPGQEQGKTTAVPIGQIMLFKATENIASGEWGYAKRQKGSIDLETPGSSVSWSDERTDLYKIVAFGFDISTNDVVVCFCLSKSVWLACIPENCP